MKQVVAQLPPPRRGVQRAGAEVPAAPTGGYQQLQAGTFTLEYPNGWQPFEDKQTGTVAIGPRQGFLQDSTGKVSIGCGALLSVYKPARNHDLRQATTELIQILQQSNPAMRVSSNPAPATVSGHSGLVTNLTAESPYGGAERDVLLTVAKPEGLFYMVFIAPDRSWAQLQPVFEHVAQSIRFPG